MVAWQERAAALWRPHPSIQGEDARQKARLTSGLLLALTAMSALTLLLPTLQPGAPWPPSDRWLVSILLVVMGLGYGLSRAGHPKMGLVLAIAAMEAGTWSSRWATGLAGQGESTLMFLVLPVLLAGVLLPTRWAFGVAAGTLVMAWLLEFAIDRRLGGSLDSEDVAVALLIVGVSVLAVVASSMAQRQSRLLAENSELLGQLTENIPEVLFVLSGDSSRMLFTNKAYETVVGRTVDQAMADPRDWMKAILPEDMPHVVQSLQSSAPHIDYRIQHPTAGVKHIRGRTFPVLRADGTVERLVGIAEDMTAIVQAQEKLREAQAERTRLLQQVAHDLAAPLTPLKIMVRMLQQKAGEDEQRSLAMVKRNVDHLQRLVEDVKDMARLEGGGLRIDRKDVDLSALARQAAENLASTAADRHVELAVDAPPALVVPADAGRMTQVFYNLVGNALKFTPAGGRIDVRLGVDGGFAEASVKDSGTGMNAEQMAKLFKPFSQVHAAGVLKRPEDKGSGLGLYISKAIVEAHGGTISVSSPGPGQGSTFTFRLPLAVTGPA